jgi:hypothetical protein
MAKWKCERCGAELERSGQTHYAPVCPDPACRGTISPVLDVEQIVKVLAASMEVEPRQCVCGQWYADRDVTHTKCPPCRGLS